MPRLFDTPRADKRDAAPVDPPHDALGAASREQERRISAARRFRRSHYVWLRSRLIAADTPPLTPRFDAALPPAAFRLTLPPLMIAATPAFAMISSPY